MRHSEPLKIHFDGLVIFMSACPLSKIVNNISVLEEHKHACPQVSKTSHHKRKQDSTNLRSYPPAIHSNSLDSVPPPPLCFAANESQHRLPAEQRHVHLGNFYGCATGNFFILRLFVTRSELCLQFSVCRGGNPHQSKANGVWRGSVPDYCSNLGHLVRELEEEKSICKPQPSPLVRSIKTRVKY